MSESGNNSTEETMKEPMKKETKIGIGITILILVVIATYIYFGWSSFKVLNPNEWGDFMAGSIGVLALVWLIVGYFLQSKELSQNTKALIAQIAESEKQTKEFTAQATATEELIKVTLRQAIANEKLVKLHESQAVKKEIEKIESVKPRFISGGGDGGPRGQTYKIINKGQIIYDLKVNVANEDVKYNKDSYKIVCLDTIIELKYLAKTSYKWPIVFSFQYNDIYGNMFTENFEIGPKFKLTNIGERELISKSSD